MWKRTRKRQWGNKCRNEMYIGSKAKQDIWFVLKAVKLKFEKYRAKFGRDRMTKHKVSRTDRMRRIKQKRRAEREGNDAKNTFRQSSTSTARLAS